MCDRLLQFNLAIKDIPEVTHEAKKALAGQLPGIGRSMCVEISLKTAEVKVQAESSQDGSATCWRPPLVGCSCEVQQ